MPRTSNDGIDLFYEVLTADTAHGSDRASTGEHTKNGRAQVPADDAVVFIGEAGFGAWQWAWQTDPITRAVPAVVWDLRGTGRSDSPAGPYTVEILTSDLEAILAETAVTRAHLVGVGLGGMIALEYASRYTRARSLALINTAATGNAVDAYALRALYRTPNADTDAWSHCFSPAFLDTADEQLTAIERWREDDDASQAGFDEQLAAMTGFEAEPLHTIQQPALVLHGLDNPVIPFDAGRELAAELPHGTLEPVEGRHCCFIEHSRAVTDRLLDFLLEEASIER